MLSPSKWPPTRIPPVIVATMRATAAVEMTQVRPGEPGRSAPRSPLHQLPRVERGDTGAVDGTGAGTRAGTSPPAGAAAGSDTTPAAAIPGSASTPDAAAT